MAGRILRHGTTRQRAESILKNGPDPNFREPGATIFDKAVGFSTAAVEGPFPCGTPEMYAAKKANLFATEGGPAILEVEIPAEVVALAVDEGGDIRFQVDEGLEELLLVWPTLSKRIV